jgi:perosamine synthetase
MRRIPIYQPLLGGNEKKYVNDCLDSTWISSKGEYVERFESSITKIVGTKYATSVCNGTVALHLALVSIGIGQGDEVIVPTLTYIASVNAIRYTGASPVFVDSIRTTWQLDPSEVERRITSRTRAIMVVHLYGHPCEMEQIMSIAARHNLFVIEDCAEAFGSRYMGRQVGSIGHIGTFSFFGNKTITTGEGGMVVTNDKTLFDRACHYKGQGLAAHRQYWHDVIGYNYRMTNICAAIGLAQLEQLDGFIENKRRIANRYKNAFSSIPVEMLGEADNVFSTYWMSSILTRDAAERDRLRSWLDEVGIETRPVFYPVHTMPMYSQKFQRHPIAEDIGWRGVNLPSWPGLPDRDLEEIISATIKFFSCSD